MSRRASGLLIERLLEERSEASDSLRTSGEVGARSELLMKFFRRKWRVLIGGEPLKRLERLMGFRTSDGGELLRSERLKKKGSPLDFLRRGEPSDRGGDFW